MELSQVNTHYRHRSSLPNPFPTRQCISHHHVIHSPSFPYPKSSQPHPVPPPNGFNGRALATPPTSVLVSARLLFLVPHILQHPTEWSCHNNGPSSTAPNNKKMAILVDKRRQEATKAFLKRVADAQLTRRNGERRWVDVYDWRVLPGTRTRTARS